MQAPQQNVSTAKWTAIPEAMRIRVAAQFDAVALAPCQFEFTGEHVAGPTVGGTLVAFIAWVRGLWIELKSGVNPPESQLCARVRKEFVCCHYL